jgi:hypothetical protein
MLTSNSGTSCSLRSSNSKQQGTEEREYFPVKARHVATEWEVRQRKAKLERNAVRRQGQGVSPLHTLRSYIETSCERGLAILAKRFSIENIFLVHINSG